MPNAGLWLTEGSFISRYSDRQVWAAPVDHYSVVRDHTAIYRDYMSSRSLLIEQNRKISSMPEPYTISIHYENGDPDGIRLVQRHHWDGRAIAFPRDQWQSVKDDEEAFKTGVYLLLGHGNDPMLPNVYIGQSDTIPKRFARHLAKRQDWHLAVIFGSTTGSLNAAHIRWLEHELIKRAKSIGRCILTNSNDGSAATLDRLEQARMNSFLRQMLEFYPLLGVHVFTPVQVFPDRTRPDTPAPAASPLPVHEDMVRIKSNGRNITSHALFHRSTGKVTVLAGSHAQMSPTPGCPDTAVATHKKLIEDGILTLEGNRYRFTRDHSFDSPSTAATALILRSSNGWIQWKLEDGRPLDVVRTNASKAN